MDNNQPLTEKKQLDLQKHTIYNIQINKCIKAALSKLHISQQISQIQVHTHQAVIGLYYLNNKTSISQYVNLPQFKTYLIRPTIQLPCTASLIH